VIGTIEALGVFVLAILPGFVALRVTAFGQPPLRARGLLGELGAAVLTSGIGWTVLYVWRGRDLLPIVLEEQGRTTADRLDAFAELAALSLLIGVGLGVLGRLVVLVFRAMTPPVLTKLDRRNPGEPSSGRPGLRPRAERWLARQIRERSRPGYAWDRLLSRVASRGERVICRIKTKSGGEVIGVLARRGYLDWEADGRGVLLDKEVRRNAAGQLEPLAASRGLFVPGDEVSSLSVVHLPDDAVLSEEHG
jgi:hypothetical protein